jgi:UDP-GlcNAc:undecaprenyl-phosphate GlcNAc-1-phosphate transferase
MYSLGILTITAFLLSLILTPVLRDCSTRMGLVDRPDQKRKLHRAPTPRTGGVPILLAYAGAYAILLLLPLNGSVVIGGHLGVIWSLMPPVGLIFATGLLDDWLDLKPWQKLAGQLSAAVWAFWAGVRIIGVEGHPSPDWLSFLLTVGWLILCSNAFNLIDGIDGLATGVGLTATLTTFLAAILQGDMMLGLATAPLAGALFGFLRYNFNPASVFLGDSGSLLIGFLLGAYGIIWSQKSNRSSAAIAATSTTACWIADSLPSGWLYCYTAHAASVPPSRFCKVSCTAGSPASSLSCLQPLRGSACSRSGTSNSLPHAAFYGSGSGRPSVHM